MGLPGSVLVICAGVVCQQPSQLILRDAQRRSQPRPDPRLGRVVTCLPPLHRGALDIQPFSQALLAKASNLASSSKTTPMR